MAISKTLIKQHLTRKTNPKTGETIRLAKQKKAWLPLAKIISGPTRQYVNLNLEEIDSKAQGAETVIVPGKVLGIGAVSKKMKICALSFSATALDKLKKSKQEATYIIDEIKSNPEAKGVKILQ